MLPADSMHTSSSRDVGDLPWPRHAATVTEVYPFERTLFIFRSAARRILVPCSSTELARSAKIVTNTTALSLAVGQTGRSPMCGVTRTPT